MSTVQQAAPTVCPDAAHMGEHACTNRAQCWEPCGELGHSEEHAQAIHPDDEAVDRFAAVLKDKLTVARTTCAKSGDSRTAWPLTPSPSSAGARSAAPS